MKETISTTVGTIVGVWANIVWGHIIVTTSVAFCTGAAAFVGQTVAKEFIKWAKNKLKK